MPPLTERQRYQIEHDIRLGLSNELIAKGVGFSVRTIERELSRCGSRARYRAKDAQAHRPWQTTPALHGQPETWRQDGQDGMGQPGQEHR